MIEQQQKLVLSPYTEIYELVVPKDNLLRQIKELVDFEFIYDELLDKYCLDNGRNAVPPIRMFKYLLLKAIYDLSDVDVVERSKYDMSFKYFLDMAPEETVINPSSLTKFRKLRLKDMNLLDMLISKTVQIALDKKIIKSKSIIVDATHTKSRYNQKTPRQALQEQSKNLRRTVYEVDETMKEKFPNKNTEDSLEKELRKKFHTIIMSNKTVGHTGIARLCFALSGNRTRSPHFKRSLSGGSMSRPVHARIPDGFLYRTLRDSIPVKHSSRGSGRDNPQ